VGRAWQTDDGAHGQLNPEVFFATCARLIPKDVQLTVQQHYSSALDEIDLAILKAIRSGIPSANAQTPEAVLQFTLDAIRAPWCTATDYLRGHN
jgi:hypothetical protein